MSIEASEWPIEPLRADHDHNPFNSGNAALDTFLKEYAGQNEKRKISKTYVAVPKGSKTIVGYATIRFGSVGCPAFQKKDVRRFPKYPIPVLHLGRLAVDQSYRGRGIGGFLLASVMAKSWRASQIAGLCAIEVVAKDKAAKNFYLQYDFKEFLDDTQHLYLMVETFKGLFES